MRNRTKWVIAGSSVLGLATMMTAGAGATSAQPAVASIRLSASSGSAAGSAGADQAAVSYVNANYPGSGTANVLVTSPDVEHGVPVYDIRIVAPSGATYVVHVQQSNDAVLSASPAEKQVTTTPVTTTPVTTSPVTTSPVTTTPEPIQPKEPTQATSSSESSGGSLDTKGNSGSSSTSSSGKSVDHQGNSSDKAKSASKKSDG